MRVYLDHNATTPLREEVADACARALRETFGNPSSSHAVGAAARAALERARAQVAELVGAAPGEIVFTSGATEANHLALRGVRGPGGEPIASVVTTPAEHPSLLEAAAALEAAGTRVTRLGVDREGLLDPGRVRAALGPGSPRPALVALLWANNETGVVQDVAAIGRVAREAGALLHLDATQALGKVPVDLGAVPADLLAGSAHKLNGPKGVGFLAVRRGVVLEPLLRGGPQERRRRGGTENVPGIVGLGVACELARRELVERAARQAALRDRLWEGLRAKLTGVHRNGSARHVLPNTLNVRFDGVHADVLLEALDLEGVAVSAGAACASGSTIASPVLSALGLGPEEARASLRFSVGHGVDEAQIDHVLALLPDLVARVRAAVAAERAGA